MKLARRRPANPGGRAAGPIRWWGAAAAGISRRPLSPACRARLSGLICCPPGPAPTADPASAGVGRGLTKGWCRQPIGPVPNLL